MSEGYVPAGVILAAEQARAVRSVSPP